MRQRQWIRNSRTTLVSIDNNNSYYYYYYYYYYSPLLLGSSRNTSVHYTRYHALRVSSLALVSVQVAAVGWKMWLRIRVPSPL